MKVKSTMNCRRDRSCPYVSERKSYEVYSMVQLACEPADLDTSTQTFQLGFKDVVCSKEHETDKNSRLIACELEVLNTSTKTIQLGFKDAVCSMEHEADKKSTSIACELADLDTSTLTSQIGFKDVVCSKDHEADKNQISYTEDVTMAQTSLLYDEDLGSILKSDSLPSDLSSCFGTSFSPSIASNEVHCYSFDAVVREQSSLAPQVDDNSSSGNQTSHVLYALDSCLNELFFTEIPADSIRAFDNNVHCNIFSDHEFSGTNLICNVNEGFMSFPSLEETIEATYSHHGVSCEESQQMYGNPWFHFTCQQTMPCVQEFDTSCSLIGSGEVDYFDPESFVRNFLELSDESNPLPALVSKETSKRKSITLVLDLDETLVHSTMAPCQGADFTFQSFYHNKDRTVYVRKRPYLESFLNRVSEMFEVIIFTASQRGYAEKLLDILDADRKFFSRQIYRDSCIMLDGSFTKDLTILGIDLAKVFIIDNTPQVFKLQPDNGIPIKSWYNDPFDNSLISLLPFLETLVDVDDVRPIIAHKFRE